jgi:hypothetical protein
MHFARVRRFAAAGKRRRPIIVDDADLRVKVKISGFSMTLG